MNVLADSASVDHRSDIVKVASSNFAGREVGWTPDVQMRGLLRCSVRIS